MVSLPDPGGVRTAWLVKAWFWCDVCHVTTLHVSDGPVPGGNGGSRVWRWLCQDCGDWELRAVGPILYDDGPPEGIEAGDGPGDMAEVPEALDYLKEWSARDWLIGCLADRPMPASWLIRLAWGFRIHERTLREVKRDLGIVSVKWRGRWFWVPPWIPWPRAWLADGWGGTRGVQPSLQGGLSGDPNEDDLGR